MAAAPELGSSETIAPESPPAARRSFRRRLGRAAGLLPPLIAVLGVALVFYLVLWPQGDNLPRSVAAPRAEHPAPDFALRDINGVARVLHQQIGRAVLLNFWGINCLPCRHEMPEVQRAVAHFHGQPVTIWGVDEQGDDAASIRLFIGEIHVSYPQLPDPRLTVGHRYEIDGIPVNVFVRPDGLVSAVHLGALTYPDFVAKLDRALQGQ